MQKIVLSNFVASCLLLSSLALAQERPLGDKGQTLHNGIEVPAEWPPRLSKFPTSVERDAVVPPYLTSPPTPRAPATATSPRADRASPAQRIPWGRRAIAGESESRKCTLSRVFATSCLPA